MQSRAEWSRGWEINGKGTIGAPEQESAKQSRAEMNCKGTIRAAEQETAEHQRVRDDWQGYNKSS